MSERASTQGWLWGRILVYEEQGACGREAGQLHVVGGWAPRAHVVHVQAAWGPLSWAELLSS